MHLPSLVPSLQVFLAGLALLTLLVAPVARADNPVESLPPPPPLRDARFGAVEAYAAPHVATAAGVGWTRIIFWWHQLQPGGPHDWNAFYFPDGALNQELSAGRELVGLVAGTPVWASETGSVRAVPSGLYLPYDHPDNLWGQFIYRLAQRYKGQIDHWIIWNEPDIWDPSHPGFTWEGSVADYVQLLKVARRAAKAANPDAVIHLAATTFWWDKEYGREQYFKRLLDAIVADPDAAAEDSFFDVASAHVYFSPQQVWEVTRLFRAELERHGLGHKPLWINETNAPPSSDPLHPAPGLRFSISLEQQANFLLQAWALGLAAGAERISLYKTSDEPNLPVGVEPYGMIRVDGSVRPVFWSYRTLVTYLSRYTGAQLFQEGTIYRAVVQRGDLGQTTVIWNAGPVARRVSVPASSHQALLVDELGPLETIAAQAGGYALTLPPAAGQIGGTTFMLVEGAGADVQILRGGAPPPVDSPVPGAQPSPALASETPIAPGEPSVTPELAPSPVASPRVAPGAAEVSREAGSATPPPPPSETATPRPISSLTAQPTRGTAATLKAARPDTATPSATASSDPRLSAILQAATRTAGASRKPDATRPAPASSTPSAAGAPMGLAIVGGLGIVAAGAAAWRIWQRRRANS